MYEPEYLRFPSEDPIGLAGGINPYVYAANDPIDLTDRTGLAAMAMDCPILKNEVACGWPDEPPPSPHDPYFPHDHQGGDSGQPVSGSGGRAAAEQSKSDGRCMAAVLGAVPTVLADLGTTAAFFIGAGWVLQGGKMIALGGRLSVAARGGYVFNATTSAAAAHYGTVGTVYRRLGQGLMAGSAAGWVGNGTHHGMSAASSGQDVPWWGVLPIGVSVHTARGVYTTCRGQ